MYSRITSVAVNPVMFFLILLGLILMPSAEGLAKKKKRSLSKYSRVKKSKSGFAVFPRPTAGKQVALDMLRSDASPELMQLAGIESMGNPTAVVTRSTEQQELPTEGENIAELEKEDDVQVDIESFKMLWLSYVDPSEAKPETLQCGIEKRELMDAVMDWIGTRYNFGGTTKNGIDCSAFVRSVFAQCGNITLPRTAQTQIEVGRPVMRVSDLQFGDMIFFHTMNHAYVSHVGIYLGDNLFAHASSRYGVTISSLQSTYYANRIIGARRLTASDMKSLAGRSQEIVTR